MKSGLYAIVLTLLASPAMAEEMVKCKDPLQINSCVDYDGGLDAVQKLALENNMYLIMAHSAEASGAYNPAYELFLWKSDTEELINVGSTNYTDIDLPNRVIASFSKGRGVADYGTIDFYQINVKEERLDPLKTFQTQTTPDGDYIDEESKVDESGGYMVRAKNFSHEMKYNLPFIDSLESGEEDNG